MASHYDFPLHEVNSGSFFDQGVLPLPPTEGLSVKINTYNDVDEPRFDPKVHLDLQQPRFIRTFPLFEETTKTPKVDSYKGSCFAYTAPFQVLSQEGIEVLREIIEKNEKALCPPKSMRGAKKGFRGGYYLSPFIRDLQNCRELLDFFGELVGEPLIPHCTFSNVPNVRNMSDDGLQQMIQLSIILDQHKCAQSEGCPSGSLALGLCGLHRRDPP